MSTGAELDLELTGVYQHVGGRCALADINLAVPAGTWLLIVGLNGAGKSLLTRLILGLDAPSAGTVRVLGQDLQALNARAMTALRGQMGAVLQGGSLLEHRSVIENLLLPLVARANCRTSTRPTSCAMPSRTCASSS